MPCFQVVIVLTTLASLKILFVETKDDLKTGYSSSSARAFEELEIFRKFSDGKDPVVVVVFVMAKDGGSMARIDHLNETVNIIDYVGTHFPVKNQTYYRMCKNFCDANEPIRQFRNGLLLHSTRHAEVGGTGGGNTSDAGLINISFPIMKFLGRDLDLSPYFFGVDVDSTKYLSETLGTNIKYVKLVALHFRTQRPSEWSTDDALRWERLVGSYFRSEYNSSLIRPIVFSIALTQDEVVRAGFAFMPYISVGFMIMFAFAVTTVSAGSAYMKQFSIQKIIYAFIGCITPLMATSTALGLLFLFGMRPGSILCVTPFLVLAIGVDDAFLMINAWNRTEAEMRSKTVVYPAVRDRMVAVSPFMPIIKKEWQFR
ncbi:unnamed protein product [Gongylonema pulchrum]|uniref:SSD domain-containing protein n=1 Tax=Gongylonema pulchrum TaxID=637853 RepID=A0A183CYY1_9BILA|nr:unnamed protein product [Gongylonema pulchrum]